MGVFNEFVWFNVYQKIVWKIYQNFPRITFDEDGAAPDDFDFDE